MTDIAQVNGRLAAGIDKAIASAVDMMRDHGATDDEVDAMLRRYVRELEQWRIDTLARIQRFMDEPDAPSHGLQ